MGDNRLPNTLEVGVLKASLSSLRRLNVPPLDSAKVALFLSLVGGEDSSASSLMIAAFPVKVLLRGRCDVYD